MKVGFALSIALLFCCSATAQEQAKLQFLLNGGVSLPLTPEEFEEHWRTGVNLGGGVGYRLSSRFSLWARVNYDQFPISSFIPNFLWGTSIDVQGGDFSCLSVSGELKASFVDGSNKISPYVIAGGGIAHLSTGSVTISMPYDNDLVWTPYDYIYGSKSLLDPRFLDLELSDLTIEGESESKAMAIVGGGVDVPLAGRFGIFVESRCQLSFTEEERASHLTFAAGLRISVW